MFYMIMVNCLDIRINNLRRLQTIHGFHLNFTIDSELFSPGVAGAVLQRMSVLFGVQDISRLFGHILKFKSKSSHKVSDKFFFAWPLMSLMTDK